MSEIISKRAFSRVSATQVAMYRECPRKWYTNYILGMKPPPTPAMALGTKVHEHLERYLTDGTPPPDTEEGKIAASGLGALPPPGEVGVEGSVSIPGALVPFVGVIDYLDVRGDVPTVGDHKTASAKKWLKTPEQLTTNVQMTSYGRYALEVVSPAADEVRLVHHYYGTKKRRWSQTVDVVVSRGSIDEAWRSTCETVEEMADAACRDESAIPQDFSMCMSYGGCPFRGRCHDSEEAFPSPPVLETTDNNTIRGNDMTSVLDRFKNRLKTEPAPAPAAPPNGKSAASSPAGDGINAPEAAVEDSGSALTFDYATGPSSEDSVETEPSPEPEAPKTRRPRRTKAEIADDRRVAAASSISEDEARALRESARGAKDVVEWRDDAEVSVDVPSPAETAVAPLRTLYVGCMPVKGSDRVTFFSDWIAKIEADVCKQKGVAHVAMLQFNEGFHLLAATVKTVGWPEGVTDLHIDPFDTFGKHCYTTLFTNADIVVHKI